MFHSLDTLSTMQQAKGWCQYFIFTGFCAIVQKAIYWKELKRLLLSKLHSECSLRQGTLRCSNGSKTEVDFHVLHVEQEEDLPWWEKSFTGRTFEKTLHVCLEGLLCEGFCCHLAGYWGHSHKLSSRWPCVWSEAST